MPLIHLATGITVCGKPRFWCRAVPEIKYEPYRVTNGTETRERATCTDCLREYDKVVADLNAKIVEPKTYELGKDEYPFILCLMCRRKSYHPEDIRNLYCGGCHEYHRFRQTHGETKA